jgi:hypothetical protein
MLVLTANGDVFRVDYIGDCNAVSVGFKAPQRMGNIWSAGPTPSIPTTMGQLKVRYR